MLRNHKPPGDRLQKYYGIIYEIALILSLVIFLVAFKVRLKPEEHKIEQVQKQEAVKMEDVEQTKQQNQPPPPPRPQVPVEVPNDEIVQEQSFDLNTELDLDQKLTLPPPPKQEETKEKKEEEEEIFVIVEQEPKLIGGLESLQQLIKYPQMAREAGIEGRVYVQFIINKNGEVEDPTVIRGIGGGCDQEALRVVKKAKFVPGRQRGRAVRVQFVLPIRFKLEHNS